MPNNGYVHRSKNLSKIKTILLGLGILAVMLLIGANLKAQELELGSSTASTTIEIPVDKLPPEISPLYELVPVETDIIVPEKEGENIALRKANTEVYENIDGSKSYKIYSAPIYTIDQDGYFTKELDYQYQLKPTAIRAKTWKETAFNYLFKIPLAYAQSYFSSGEYDMQYTDAVWNTAHDASASETGSLPSCAYIRGALIGGVYYVERSPLQFDTSAITDGYDIGTSSIFIKWETDVNGDSIALVQYTGADSPTTADFDQFDTDLIASEVPFASLGTSYYDFVLNSVGTSSISDDGLTKFGVRAKKDNDDTTPVNQTQICFRTSAYTGTASDPYIYVNAYAPTAGTTTTSTATSCDMVAGELDDDTISTYALYWFYLILCFVILTLGYWIVDRFFHALSGKKYD